MRKVLEQTVCRIDVRIEFLQQEQAGAGGDASYKDGGVHQYLYRGKETCHLSLFQLFGGLREGAVDVSFFVGAAKGVPVYVRGKGLYLFEKAVIVR